jgi:hypothetical protein
MATVMVSESIFTVMVGQAFVVIVTEVQNKKNHCHGGSLSRCVKAGKVNHHRRLRNIM